MAMKTVNFNQQRGAVLILGLALLVALTIIGVASMSNNTLQSRMAGNLVDSNLAFNAAETALRGFEIKLDVNRPPHIKDNCQGETFDATPGVPCVLKEDDTRINPDWMKDTNHTWWTSDTGGGVAFVSKYTGQFTAYTGGANPQPIITTAPRVIAEFQSSQRFSQVLDSRNLQSGASYYRVTARGSGASDNSQAMVQQIVARYK